MDQGRSAGLFLREIGRRVEAIRADLPCLVEMGEGMAEHLVSGGEIFVPPVAKWWVSEFSNRAGGLMGISWGDHAGPFVSRSPHDVAYVALPAKWDEESSREWKKLVHSPAKIFALGEASQVQERGRVESFTGLGEASAQNEGFRQFEQLVRGWLVAGEMIAACTRCGRMPHMWMSVWLEGALVRNASFYNHDNLREPWYVPVFHEKIYVPPLEARRVSEEFLRELLAIHALLIQQEVRLRQGAQWIAQAKQNKRRVSMVAVGHSYPEILEMPESDWPVAWSKSISNVSRAHPDDLAEGDVAIHFGYSPVDTEHVKGIVERGTKLIYSSPYGRPATLKDHPNLLWLDLPWRPGDATVDVPGYSVRILPMSSTAHTMAYYALLAEAGL
ncbi:MAG TPA: hypothetical protein VF669_19350 [Tepidisphaeraceae bacterium]|jgi:hypothetical protein